MVNNEAPTILGSFAILMLLATAGVYFYLGGLGPEVLWNINTVEGLGLMGIALVAGSIGSSLG